MGAIKKSPSVKLFFGLIFKDDDLFNKVKSIIENLFGKADSLSPYFEFNFTDYYEKEFGTGLKKRFFSVKKLINPQELSAIKVITNKIEEKFSNNGNRLINIDPGYLDLAKLVLASTKDFAHRIYLGKGIFTEITLIYKDKSYRPLEWTYPDYKTSGYISFFESVRDIYAADLSKNIS